MSKARFRTGNYTGTISINKKNLEYTLDLSFKEGNIKGQGSHESGSFQVWGTYNDRPPYSLQLNLENAFGNPQLTLEGFHYADGSIFGNWSPGPNTAKGGDFKWKYKEETPEEREKKRMQTIEDGVNTILSMGFTKDLAYRALDITNGNVEQAIDQLMNGEIEEIPRTSNTDVAPSEPTIKQLCDMGFSREQAVQALKDNSNNIDMAINWLFAGSN